MRLGRFNRLKGEGRKAEFLTRQEAESFSSVEGAPSRPLPAIFDRSSHGIRLGELLALEWEDIQFGESEEDTNRYILVRHNFTHGQFTSPKNRKERWVDLNRELRQVLIDLRDRRMLEAMQRGEDEVTGLVFPSETGGPLDSRNVYHRDFLPCLKAAGLRRVTWHCVRHSFASAAHCKWGQPCLREGTDGTARSNDCRYLRHLVPGGNISGLTAGFDC